MEAAQILVAIVCLLLLLVGVFALVVVVRRRDTGTLRILARPSSSTFLASLADKLRTSQWHIDVPPERELGIELIKTDYVRRVLHMPLYGKKVTATPTSMMCVDGKLAIVFASEYLKKRIVEESAKLGVEEGDCRAPLLFVCNDWDQCQYPPGEETRIYRYTFPTGMEPHIDVSGERIVYHCERD